MTNQPTREELEQEIKDLREENESLQAQLTSANDDIDELTEENAKYINSPDVVEAVDYFLGLVERPVGKLSYSVPQSYQTDRAILALFDALNRNP